MDINPINLVQNVLDDTRADSYVAELKYGSSTKKYQSFFDAVDEALSKNKSFGAQLRDAHAMYPMNVELTRRVISSAESTLKILTTDLPSFESKKQPLYQDPSVVNSLINAAKVGVKIDIILRSPKKFGFSHPLYALAVSPNVSFHDAQDLELVSCNCRFLIADKKFMKFRSEGDDINSEADVVDVVIDSSSKLISDIVDNFDQMISDPAFAKSRVFGANAA